MKKYSILFFIVFFVNNLFSQSDTIIIETLNDSSFVNYNTIIEVDTTILQEKQLLDTILDEKFKEEKHPSYTGEKLLIYKRMLLLDESSPLDYDFNNITYFYIARYLNRDVKLISRMLGVSPYYFPMMEQQLDRFQIPLELKYLAIVESALNPRARSRSGATGLWQFMYNTGKEYNLEVTSYIDERQDPLKSTIAACEYFNVLYDIFGDWNLVLAAYNGGPGYLKRLIAKTELHDYWELRPHLRKETQGYVPKFIAVSYAMTFYKEHNIEIFDSHMDVSDRDTISFNEQVPYNLISDMFCVTKETLNYLNPSFKKDLLPEGDAICLPSDVILDIVRNEDNFYDYLQKVENKEILVNETRIIYIVEKGDYLGKISKRYNLKVHDIKKWNNLHSDNLSIGDKLILYIPDEK